MHLVRSPLSALESRLQRAGFLSINRSTLVNLNHVAEIHALFHGDATVRLRDGTELRLRRTYRAGLEAMMKGSQICPGCPPVAARGSGDCVGPRL